MESLGVRLRTLRKAKGLTQQELADLLGMAKSSISMYESGKHEPNLGTLRKIASCLGVSIGEIISSTPDHIESVTFLLEQGVDRIANAYAKLDDYGKITAVECIECLSASRNYTGHSSSEIADLLIGKFYNDNKLVSVFNALVFMSNDELNRVFEFIKQYSQESSKFIQPPDVGNQSES